MTSALLPTGRRCVTVVWPDNCSARMTEAAAWRLMESRGPMHGLRVYEIGWDGCHEKDGGYLATDPEERRERPDPTIGAATRIRSLQSVERDLTTEQRKVIAADALRLGPEATGRRWQLSKHSVQQVMKLEGRPTPARGRWKSRGGFARPVVRTAHA